MIPSSRHALGKLLPYAIGGFVLWELWPGLSSAFKNVRQDISLAGSQNFGNPSATLPDFGTSGGATGGGSTGGSSSAGGGTGSMTAAQIAVWANQIGIPIALAFAYVAAHGTTGGLSDVTAWGVANGFLSGASSNPTPPPTSAVAPSVSRLQALVAGAYRPYGATAGQFQQIGGPTCLPSYVGSNNMDALNAAHQPSDVPSIFQPCLGSV